VVLALILYICTVYTSYAAGQKRVCTIIRCLDNFLSKMLKNTVHFQCIYAKVTGNVHSYIQKIILLKKTAASLYRHRTSSFWLFNQAFVMVSLRRMAITSVIFVIREAVIVVCGGGGARFTTPSKNTANIVLLRASI
jgi:hypothetical protein